MTGSRVAAALVVVLALGGLVAARLADDDAAVTTTGRVESAADGESAAGTDDGDAPTGEAAGEPADGGPTGDAATGAPTDGTPTGEAADGGPEDLGPAPDLVDLDGWLQTDATGLDDFADQVRIVQFWTFGCVNCRNTLPHLQELYATYHDQGLEIIGVHAPEFDHERDPDAIASAAEDLGVIWPIALDTEKTNFRDWQEGPRNFWPRTYVLDRDGHIRFDHIGEGAYDELEATVAQLLSESQ